MARAFYALASGIALLIVLPQAVRAGGPRTLQEPVISMPQAKVSRLHGQAA